MTDVRSAWKDAGDRFATLGASLKAHYEEQRGEDGESTKKELGEAAKQFTGAIQDAVDALVAAAKDPAVKDDVRKVGASLTGALSATFAEVSDDVRRLADKSTTEPETKTETEPEPEEPPGAASSEVDTETDTESEGEPAPKVEPWGTP
jgi:hypothetical protein